MPSAEGWRPPRRVVRPCLVESQPHENPSSQAPPALKLMENDLVKRLVWSGLLAGVGALTTIVANRIATEIWTRVFHEDPPDY